MAQTRKRKPEPDLGKVTGPFDLGKQKGRRRRCHLYMALSSAPPPEERARVLAHAGGQETKP